MQSWARIGVAAGYVAGLNLHMIILEGPAGEGTLCKKLSSAEGPTVWMTEGRGRHLKFNPAWSSQIRPRWLAGGDLPPPS